MLFLLFLLYTLYYRLNRIDSEKTDVESTHSSNNSDDAKNNMDSEKLSAIPPDAYYTANESNFNDSKVREMGMNPRERETKKKKVAASGSSSDNAHELPRITLCLVSTGRRSVCTRMHAYLFSLSSFCTSNMLA